MSTATTNSCHLLNKIPVLNVNTNLQSFRQNICEFDNSENGAVTNFSIIGQHTHQQDGLGCVCYRSECMSVIQLHADCSSCLLFLQYSLLTRLIYFSLLLHLIRSESTAVLKAYNFARQYNSKHKKVQKLYWCCEKRKGDLNVFRKPSSGSFSALQTHYRVAQLLAKENWRICKKILLHILKDT